jgi:N-acylneuraminate cytidylyltransferase
MDIIGLIPARGGSKGIPGKNKAKLCGMPLIEYTFIAAKESKLLQRVILSTDDRSIAELGLSKGIEVPFLRPDDLAQDNSSMLDVAIHLLDYLRSNENFIPDYLIILQPTSPLRTRKHIDEACRLVFQDRNVDTVVSVCKVPHNYQPESIYSLQKGELVDYIKSPYKKYDRHHKSQLYARNGPAILISKTMIITKDHSFYGKRIVPYFMKPEESFDINEAIDLVIVEKILSRKGKCQDTGEGNS